MNTIRAYASPDAHVIYGTAYDDDAGRRDPRDGGGHRPVAPGRSAARRRRCRCCAPAPTTCRSTCRRSTTPSAARRDRRSNAGGSQPDYGGMAVPSVWRTNRTQAAAKVDALSSGRHGRFRDPGLPAQAGGLNAGIRRSPRGCLGGRGRARPFFVEGPLDQCIRSARPNLKSRHAPATHPQDPDPGRRRGPAQRPAGGADAAAGRSPTPASCSAASTCRCRSTSRCPPQAVTDTRMASTISQRRAPRCTPSST